MSRGRGARDSTIEDDYEKIKNNSIKLDDFYAKNEGGNFFFFTTKGNNIFTDTEFPKEKCYIIFGREDAGIPEEILKEHPDTSLRIPMIDEARSLNLSNSAAIVAYEVLRQWGYPGLLTEGQLTKFEW